MWFVWLWIKEVTTGNNITFCCCWTSYILSSVQFFKVWNNYNCQYKNNICELIIQFIIIIIILCILKT